MTENIASPITHVYLRLP